MSLVCKSWYQAVKNPSLWHVVLKREFKVPKILPENSKAIYQKFYERKVKLCRLIGEIHSSLSLLQGSPSFEQVSAAMQIRSQIDSLQKLCLEKRLLKMRKQAASIVL